MNLITLDFETYYDKDYSLKKVTTEEYIRSPDFEVIGVGIKLNDRETEWASGTHEQVKEYLLTFPWSTSVLNAHNTMFDGAILNWIFDIKPKLFADTLCMARGIHGVDKSASLDALAKRYNIGVKGKEVLNTVGKHREDFTEEELSKFGDYCVNDVDLSFDLFKRMGKGFPKKEFKLIDLTLRMFIEPTLDLDVIWLENHLTETRQRKEKMLVEAGCSKDDLMSNPKFAELLKNLGVEAPTKISPTTGNKTLALAKSDEGFKKLIYHHDDRVKKLVNARLELKSTLEETRTERFINIGKRGLLPVPVKYYAAHTGRWGGDDKINLQNLPSRGDHAKRLKSSIVPPRGCVLIDADSSQIEARVLAWLAQQDYLTEAFRKGEDVYRKMAGVIYGVVEDAVTKEQRFVGKTTILGAGYGMGALKFQNQLQTFGFSMPIDEARRVIKVYRDTNDNINKLWRDAQRFLQGSVNGEDKQFGLYGVLKIEEGKIKLPSGLYISYDGLKATKTDIGFEYSYMTRNGETRIYGGKVIENVCQAIARCIIGEQMIRIAKKYKVVLTVHDSIVCCVRDKEAEEAQQYIEECMRWTPEWAGGLPVDCESGIGKSYGECE
jgi:DNA polymerase|tara:strand:- start:1388 stop:3208 length:1821 start_codon:yes stop_codon:yes gene_type:complete